MRALPVAMSLLLGSGAAAEPAARGDLGSFDAETAITTVLATGPLLRRPTIGEQVEERMTVLTGDLGLYLSRSTGDLLDLRFDWRTRRGQFHIGGHLNNAFGLRLDSKVEVLGSVAHLRSHLQLGLGGSSYVLKLPDVQVEPVSVMGERGVEVRVPLLRTPF